MKTPIFSMTPDYAPMVRLMAMQTRFAIETSQSLMKLAMMPWQGLPLPGYGSICGPLGTVSAEVSVKEAPAAPKPVERTPKLVTAKVIEATPTPVAEKPADPAPAKPTPAVKAAAPAPIPTPVAAGPAPAPVKTETPAPKASPAPASTAAKAPPMGSEAAMIKPAAIAAPSRPDDLTVLNGVGPKLAEALNAEGIYSYAQIAAWTEANVAWIDENLPGVRGRASRNGWVAQAAELAK